MNENPIIPFGKYRGCFVSQLPTQYMAWCLSSLDKLEPYLRLAMRREISYRGELEDEAVETQGTRQLGNVKKVVQRCYREMTMKWHPDRGGSHESMIAIGDFHDRLQELLSA